MPLKLYISAYFLKCFCFAPSHPSNTTVKTGSLSEKSDALALERLKLGWSHWIEAPSEEFRDGVSDRGCSGGERDKWEKEEEEKGLGEEGKGTADRSEHLLRESFTRGLGFGFKRGREERGRLRRWRPAAVEVRSRRGTEATMPDG
jgi:hypothetical protein